MQLLRKLMLAACISLASISHVYAAPDWGKPSEGFVIALKLDKKTYAVDDVINAHVNCTRLTAGWEVFGSLWGTENCGAEIELRDDKGALVPLRDDPKRRLRGGGPIGTTTYKKGEILTSDILVNKEYLNYFDGQQGYFISHPGTYTATAVWLAPSKDRYAFTVVYSKPVIFRITE